MSDVRVSRDPLSDDPIPLSKARALALATILVAATASAGDLAGTAWRVTLHTGAMGPVETNLHLSACGDDLCASASTGALDLLRRRAASEASGLDLVAGLLEARLTSSGDGWVGHLTSPTPGSQLSLSLDSPSSDGDRLEGSIEGGLLSGSLSGERLEKAGAKPNSSVRDYESVLAAVESVVAEKVFDPALLDAPEYRRFLADMGEIAAAATDDLGFLLGFRLAWTNRPFSHFELRRSPVPAEQMMASFDRHRVGFEAARLEFDGDLGVLRVDTMMGKDTIEQVRSAYREIAARSPAALVIDLRGNQGGAFAVKPLVEHVIDRPFDAGYFLARRWKASHDQLPTAEELAAVEPWRGWSILAFWHDVQAEGLLKIRFEPAEPNFDGPVFVVVDGESASATELAVDALRASGVATVVGERTAGEMLSQSVFDAVEGFVVSLPVADYVSTTNGRIEGAGVPVDVERRSEVALDAARVLAAAGAPD